MPRGDLMEYLGFWDSAQRRRLKPLASGERYRYDWSWMSRIYEAERRLVEIAQKEARVDEETHTLLKNSAVDPLNHDEKKIFGERDRKLDLLDKEYWRAKWKLQQDQASCQARPLDIAYTCFRSKPQWWLLPSLRDDCAKRGGCCSRDCGCCERARHAKRPDVFGHCSPSCDCCLRARGFELSPDDAAIFEPKYHLSRTHSVFRTRLMSRYFFGIDDIPIKKYCYRLPE